MLDMNSRALSSPPIGQPSDPEPAWTHLSKIVAGSAHCPSLDQPRAMARTVLNWLDANV